MGAAALQKYIGSLGGIGTSGVGSSSSYAPKELNKEVMPEKVGIWTSYCQTLFTCFLHPIHMKSKSTFPFLAESTASHYFKLLVFYKRTAW